MVETLELSLLGDAQILQALIPERINEMCVIERMKFFCGKTILRIFVK